MTLTDFLLARIAEVEEVAISVQESEPKSTSAVFTSLSAPTGTVEMSPARALAECEVKRRITVLHERKHHQCVSDSEQDGPATLWRTSMNPCDTLRALALPYADHRDYREEWKP